MQRILLCFILALVSLAKTYALNELDLLYARLDSLIEIKQQLIEKKENHLQTLKRSLQTEHLSFEERFKLNETLCEDYASYKYDSAMVYVNHCISLAQSIDNKNLYNRALISELHLLSLAGLFEEATRLQLQIDTTALSRDDLILYFSRLEELCIYKAEYTAGTPYSGHYVEQAMVARRRIWELAQPSSFTSICVQAAMADFNKNRKSHHIWNVC